MLGLPYLINILRKFLPFKHTVLKGDFAMDPGMCRREIRWWFVMFVRYANLSLDRNGMSRSSCFILAKYLNDSSIELIVGRRYKLSLYRVVPAEEIKREIFLTWAKSCNSALQIPGKLKSNKIASLFTLNLRRNSIII